MTKIAKNTICLWYDNDAEGAARFMPRPFPIRQSARCIAHPGIIRRARKAMC